MGTFKDKSGETAKLCYQALSRPSAVTTATIPACPISALSATNTPAVGMDHNLVLKPSHNNEMYWTK